MTAALFSTYSTDWTRPERPRDWDWCKYVPKEPAENARFRRELWLDGMRSQKVAEEIWIACARDPLFFINAFGWIEEPREKGQASTTIPFLTWAVQDWIVESWLPYLGKKDLLGVKPRGIGFTWLLIYFAVIHPWLFNSRRVHIGIASRDEEAVDNRHDPDSLLPKLDFSLKHLPPFLCDPGQVHRVAGKLINKWNGSTAIGYAATGDLGRGGRKWLWLMEEFAAFAGDASSALASTQYTTDCRILVSTIGKDVGNVFNVVAQDADRPFMRLMPQWPDVPPYAAGSYRSKDGVLELLDPDFRYEEGYNFKLDGKRRSYWYDDQESRGNDPRAMAREVDCNFEDAASQAIEPWKIAQILAKCESPTARGRFIYDPDTHDGTFTEAFNGPLKIWVPLATDGERQGKPPIDVVCSQGVDTSSGNATSLTSNSVASGFDRRTGRQVFEYVTNELDPIRWANCCLALAKFFGGYEETAFIVPEANGPINGMLMKEFRRLDFWTIYTKATDDTVIERQTMKLGWFNRDGAELTKELAEIVRACLAGECTILSAECVSEIGEYVWSDGKYVHGKQSKTTEESNKGKAHGDRVVAACLGWLGCRTRRIEKQPDTPPEEAPYGSTAWRLLRAEQERREQEEDEAFAW